MFSKPGSGPAVLRKVTQEASKVDPARRRDFLKKGLMVAGGAIAGTQFASTLHASQNSLPPNLPEWSKSLGAGVITNPYGQPSPFEADIVRRTVPWLTADRIAAISFTPLAELDGIITPSGLVFERYHAGVPAINPDEYRLMIHGLVERPLVFTIEDLRRFPSTTAINFLECPANGGMEWRAAQMDALQFTHGMISCCEWTGVLLSTLLEEVGVKPEARWILAEGSDG